MKKCYAFFLFFTLLFAAFNSYAQFSGGNGTAKNPYQIKTAEDLDNIRNYLGSTHSGKHYRLMNDIDLTEFLKDNADGWTPIGEYDYESDDGFNLAFQGYLHGGGYKISNFISIFAAPDYVGLFGVTHKATIDSLGIEIERGKSVTGFLYVGGLIGFADSTAISNCYVIGTIYGYEIVGGLVGSLENYSTIRNSFVSGIIVADGEAIGGIASDLYQSSIEHSYFSGKVASSLYGYAGGIAHSLSSRSTINRCYAAGTVAVHGEYAGGLAAYTNGISNKIQNSVAANESIRGALDYAKRISGKASANTLADNYALDSMSINGEITTGSTTSVNGANKSLSDLRQSDFYKNTINWDFTDVFTIWENHSLPYFQWQTAPVNILSANKTGISGTYNTIDTPDSLVIFKEDVYLTTLTNLSGGTWTYTPSTAFNNFRNEYSVIAYKSGKAPSYIAGKGTVEGFCGGNGTSFDPYQICTAEQLSAMRDFMEIDGLAVHFRLMNDINLNEFLKDSVRGWLPIGNNYTEYEYAIFQGYLHGGGHIISGLFINRPTSNYAGLFGSLQAAHIDSLGIQIATSGIIGGNSYTGGLVGSCFACTQISNCFVSGHIKGKNYVGGLVGYNIGTIKDCYNKGGDICGTYYVGGLVGTNGGGARITNSYSIANVQLTGDRIGSFTGQNFGDIYNCFFNKDISGQLQGSGYGSNGGISGKTTAELMLQSTYTNWDFSTIWKYVNRNYPRLTWETIPASIDTLFDTLVLGSYPQTQMPDSIQIYRNSVYIASVPATGFANGHWEYKMPIRILDTISAVSFFNGNETGTSELVFNPFCKGDGSAKAPLEICNVEHLVFLAKATNNGFSSQSIFYKLISNIDLKPWIEVHSLLEGWIPIGNSANPFKGNFNGNGQIIEGLTINRNEDFQGFFGYVDGGKIDSVWISNAVITAQNNVGGIVGKIVNNTTISYSYCSINIHAGGNVGGLVGSIDNADIQNSYSSGNINSTGGTAGGIAGLIANTSTIAYCYSTSNVIATAKNYVGGIVGNVENNCIVKNCVAANPVMKGQNNTGTISGITLSSTFYKNHASDKIDLVPNGGHNGTSQKLDSLKSFAFYNNPNNWQNAAWNLSLTKDSIWNIWNGASYPFLRWQYVYPDIFCAGNGSEINPFQICDTSHLATLARWVNNGENFSGKHFILLNDLDLTGWGDATGWVPIGTEANPFQGVFHGNGKVIQNLTINRPSGGQQGLFGVISGDALIEKVVLENVNMDVLSGGAVVGFANGRFNTVTVKECYSSGNISNNDWNYIGGIVGYTYSCLFDCYSSCNLLAKGYPNASVGGIVGNGCLNNCYSRGTIVSNSYRNQTGAATGIGGLSGRFGGTTNSIAINNGIFATDGDNMGVIVGDFLQVSGNVFYWDSIPLTNCDRKSGTPKTFAELQQAIFYTNGKNWGSNVPWNMDSIVNTAKTWNIWSDSSFPYLQYQTAPPYIAIANNAQASGRYKLSEKPDSILVFRNNIHVGNAILAADGMWTYIFADPNVAAKRISVQAYRSTFAHSYPVNVVYLDTIFLNKHQIEFSVGRKEKLIATILPHDATNQKVIWSSENGIIADVCEGVVTAKAVGETTIYAETELGELIDSCLVIVHSFCNGEGTQANPYQICDADDLALLAHIVNNGYNFDSTYFIQNSNIDLSTWISTYAPDLGWIPIGSKGAPYGDKPFKGYYNGNHFNISGMKINRPNTTSAGLFGYIGSGAKIRNIHLSGDTITNGSDNNIYTGGISGYVHCEKWGNDTTLIDSCINDIFIMGGKSGSTYSYSYAGGIVGYGYGFARNYLEISSSARGSGLIVVRNSINRSNVKAGSAQYSSSGGIMGGGKGDSDIFEGSNTGNISVIYCINEGIIYGDDRENAYTGGIIGHVDIRGIRNGPSILGNCLNKGTVIAGKSSNSYTGGVLGYLNQYGYRGAYVSIANCANTGTITGQGSNSATGGIIGYLDAIMYSGTNFSIKNCYAFADIIGFNNIGGIVGSVTLRADINPQVLNINNCYFSGKISSTNSSTSNIGAFIGRHHTALTTLSGNFVDTNLCNLKPIGNETTFTGIAKSSTKQMFKRTTFSGWDFTNTWAINENCHYPYLQWQNTDSLPKSKNADLDSIWVISKNGMFDTVVETLHATSLQANADTIILTIGRNIDTLSIRGFTACALANVDSIIDTSLSANKNIFQLHVVAEDTNYKKTYTVIIQKSPFCGGSGTAQDPYQICDAQSLNNLRYFLGPEHADKHYRVMNDIDLTEFLKDNMNGWMPIGNFYEELIDSAFAFQGSFHGNDHKITGLFFTPDDEYYEPRGLFGYTYLASIDNLGIEMSSSVQAYNDYFTGGLIGYCDSSSINKCYAIGNITGDMSTGGLTGVLMRSSMTHCYAACRISGSLAGGLIGSASKKSHISESYFSGVVSSIDEYSGRIGGLIGSYASNSSIEQCYASGRITCQTSGAGGLVGYSASVGTAISNSIAANNAINAPKNINKIGYKISGKFNNNYALAHMLVNDEIRPSNDSNSLDGQDKTLSELRKQRTYTDISSQWNFTNTFNLWEDHSFPYFKWQASPVFIDSIKENVVHGKCSPSCMPDSIIIFAGRHTQIVKTFSNEQWSINFPASANLQNEKDVFAMAYKNGYAPSYWVHFEQAHLKLNKHTAIISLNGSDSLFAKVLPYAEKGRTVVWKSRDTSIASVENGNVIAKNIGKVSIIAQLEPEGAYDSCIIDVVGFCGGNGSESSPFLICTAQQLDMLRLFTGSANKYRHFRIANDIDLGRFIDSTYGINGWLPIGNYIDDYNNEAAFQGLIHGGNYKITGLKINRPSTDYIGLFGILYAAHIDSLGVEMAFNASVIGRDFTGILAGRIATDFTDTASIKNCYTLGNVKGRDEVGGLIACIRPLSKDIIEIERCFSIGTVKGNTEVGGLIGDNLLQTNAKTTISNCYAYSDVEGINWVGGLIGISDTIAIGSTYITNNFSGGKIKGYSNTGGLIGYQKGGDVSNCYFNSETSGQTKGIGTKAGGGISVVSPRTTNELMHDTTFKNWDFTETWTTWTDSSVPYFPWQVCPPYIAKTSSTTIEGLYNLADIPDSILLYINGQFIATIKNLTNGFWEYTSTQNFSSNIFTVKVIAYKQGKAPSCAVKQKIFCGGSGTAQDPYQICDAEALNNLRYFLGPEHADKHYRVMNDIDLTEFLKDSASGWQPIGTSSTNSFQGTLHGSGHKITNFRINRPNSDYVGLFAYGYIENAYTSFIDSLTVEIAPNASVTGHNYVGALIGYNYRLDVKTCYVKGTVSGNSNVGGFIGYNQQTYIERSCFVGSVSGNSNVGGFVGTCVTHSVFSSRFYGSVNGGNNVGGLTGSHSMSANISDNHVMGRISGNSNVGGLTGSGSSSSTSGFSANYVSARVTGTSSVGAIIGARNGARMYNCFYDSIACGVKTGDGNGSNSGLAGTSAAPMKEKTTYPQSGSNFWRFCDTVWDIWENYSYPFMAYQSAPTIQVITSTEIAGVRRPGRAIDSIVIYKYSNGIFARVDTAKIENKAASSTNYYWSYTLRGAINGSDTLYTIAYEKNKAPSYPVRINTAFCGGNGTQANPYQICDARDLDAVRYFVSDKNINKHFRIMNDIDLTAYIDSTHGSNGWLPLACDALDLHIKLHGGGHKISGLWINRPTTDFVGLFSYLMDGMIDSLGVEVDARGIEGNGSVAPILGGGAYATVINSCYTTGEGSIKGHYDNVGGIIGYNNDNCIVRNCYSTLRLQGIGNCNGVGGIAGRMRANAKIINCYATGQHTGRFSVGGIFGAQYSGSFTFSDCFYDKNTTGCTDSRSGITGKTTAEMQQQVTYTNWDFNNIWTINDNCGYPYLRWQNTDFQKSKNADLDSIRVISKNGIFDTVVETLHATSLQANADTIILSVGRNIDTLSIYAFAHCGFTTVHKNIKDTALSFGKNIFKIYTIAEDTSSRKTYTIIISQKQGVTLSLRDSTLTYDAEAHALVCAMDCGNFTPEPKIHFSYNDDTAKPVNAGTYTIKAWTYATDSFHAADTVRATLTILKKNLTVDSFSVANKKYDGTRIAHVDNWGVLRGIISGDTVSIDTSTAIILFDTKNPGSAKTVSVSTLTLTGVNSLNYALTYPTGLTADITLDTITITALPQNKIYGETKTLDTTAFSLSEPLSEGDTIHYVSLSSAGTAASANVEKYNLIISNARGTGLNNYTFIYVNDTFYVNKAELKITALPQTKNYSDTLILKDTAFITSGLKNGDTVTSVTLFSQGVFRNATSGKYPITPSSAIGTGLSNYDIVYCNDTLTVLQLSITVKALPQNKVYGALKNLGSSMFSIIGTFIKGDTILSVSLTSSGCPMTANVGFYDITPSNASGTGVENYEIIYINDTLTVNKAVLMVRALPQNKMYGETKTLDTTAFSYNGLKNADKIFSIYTSSSGCDSSSPVGKYLLIIDSVNGNGLNNYIFTFVNDTLHVNTAILKIFTHSLNKIYGDSLTIDCTQFYCEGLKNNDSVTSVNICSNGCTIKANAGKYDIIIENATGANLHNYLITYVKDTLFVTKAPLIITTLPQTKIFNTVKILDSLAYTISGLKNNDTVLFIKLNSTGAPASARVGTYPILCSDISESGINNYEISYQNGSLSVTPGSGKLDSLQTTLKLAPAFNPSTLNYAGTLACKAENSALTLYTPTGNTIIIDEQIHPSPARITIERPVSGHQKTQEFHIDNGKDITIYKIVFKAPFSNELIFQAHYNVIEVMANPLLNGGFDFVPNAYTWFANDLIVPNTNKGSLYMPQGFPANTAYSVQVKHPNGDSTMICEYIPQQKPNQIRIYPNPTSGKLRIESGEWRMQLSILNPQFSTLTIYNALGTLIKSVNLTNETTEIDISHLPTGSYQVKFLNESKIIIKQ